MNPVCIGKLRREEIISRLINLMINDPTSYNTPTTLAHWLYDNFDKISKIMKGN